MAGSVVLGVDGAEEVVVVLVDVDDVEGDVGLADDEPDDPQYRSGVTAATRAAATVS